MLAQNYPRAESLVAGKALTGGKEEKELAATLFSEVDEENSKALIKEGAISEENRKLFKTPRTLYIMVDEVIEMLVDDEHADAKIELGFIAIDGGTFTAYTAADDGVDSDPKKNIVGGGSLEDGAYVKVKRVSDDGASVCGYQIKPADEDKKYISLEINGDLKNLVSEVEDEITGAELEIVVLEPEVEDASSGSNRVTDVSAKGAVGTEGQGLLDKIAIDKPVAEVKDKTASDADATNNNTVTVKVISVVQKDPAAENLATGDEITVTVEVTPDEGYVLGDVDTDSKKVEVSKFEFTAPTSPTGIKLVPGSEVKTTAKYTATYKITLE